VGGTPPIENVPIAIRRGQPPTQIPPVMPTRSRVNIPSLATASLPTTDLGLLQLEVQLLQGIYQLLLPDNWQMQLKLLTVQVSSGKAYDYPIPSWCRHWLLTNRSAGTGAAGQLYYWFNTPSAGATQLPQNYATLVAGQSVSENSDYNVISLFADATCTDQGWELRFMGWLASPPTG
jgi:hypothetical protein